LTEEDHMHGKKGFGGMKFITV